MHGPPFPALATAPCDAGTTMPGPHPSPSDPTASPLPLAMHLPTARAQHHHAKNADAAPPLPLAINSSCHRMPLRHPHYASHHDRSQPLHRRGIPAAQIPQAFHHPARFEQGRAPPCLPLPHQHLTFPLHPHQRRRHACPLAAGAHPRHRRRQPPPTTDPQLKPRHLHCQGKLIIAPMTPPPRLAGRQRTTAAHRRWSADHRLTP
ncbi:hypothetical protein BS78_K092700 [Paspalum vaginatum]|uniref:Uncharacterized protein n=1 Tax=Paspalum vaginatum TaxID=158149 RepID=A0A9W7XE83_9POAL|nr:hypothetical protein BS78_K092700 [Paspalum vaginatum]